MSIEIRGTNTINKGAHLMLEAVAERLSPIVALSCPPYATDYGVRARLGLGQTLHEFRSPRLMSRVADVFPAALNRRYGLVRNKDITGVVDASGFAYSDSFGVERIRREVLFGREWRNRNLKKVLLPQAFGPFENRGSLPWYKELFAQSDVIFARDESSYEYLRGIDAQAELRICPDFTIGLPANQLQASTGGAFGAIVPNVKMISTGVYSKTEYVGRLMEFADALQSNDMRPVLVVHEQTDRQVVDAVVANRPSTAVFQSDDPRILKGYLGKADFVMASRYHAVVGSLSQEVPTLVDGWSHKYGALLGDFEVPEWTLQEREPAFEATVRVLGDSAGRQRVSQRKSILTAQVDRMWQETIAVLGLDADK